MLESIAFLAGLFIMIASIIYNICIWIMSSVNGVYVNQVGAGYGNEIYKKRVNGLDVSLGWMPLGGFLKLSGMIDERIDSQEKEEIHSYDFRGKSAGQRVMIMSSGFIVPFIIGIILLAQSSPMPLMDLASLYLMITFFQLPLEVGVGIWETFYVNSVFLAGFLIFLMSTSSLASTSVHANFIPQPLKMIVVTLFYLFAFSLWIVLIRLAWINFAITNILFFFVGGMLGSGIGLIIYMLLANVIPNKK